MEPDLYDVLGIPDDAGQDKIKTVYRQLARTFHPDVNPDADAVDHFRQITEAFLVLSDPEQRTQYDRKRRRRVRAKLRDAIEQSETYLGLRVAGIDLGGVLGVSVTVRRSTLLPDPDEPAEPAEVAVLPRPKRR
jgi:curved DNA-binding protein CbpA